MKKLLMLMVLIVGALSVTLSSKPTDAEARSISCDSYEHKYTDGDGNVHYITYKYDPYRGQCVFDHEDVYYKW